MTDSVFSTIPLLFGDEPYSDETRAEIRRYVAAEREREREECERDRKERQREREERQREREREHEKREREHEEREREHQERMREREREDEKREREHEVALAQINLRMTELSHMQTMAIIEKNRRLRGTASYSQYFLESVEPNWEGTGIDLWNQISRRHGNATDWSNSLAENVKAFCASGSESELIDFLCTNLSAGLKGVREVKHTRKQGYLKDCRPDISLTEANESVVHSGNVLAIIEVKACAKTLFTDADTGQLCFMLEQILTENNICRKQAYGFLMCSSIFVLVCARRVEDQVKFSGIQAHDMDAVNIERVRSFLSSPVETLGWYMPFLPVVPGQTYRCRAVRVLGSGLTSDVYSYPDCEPCSQCVAKCYCNDFIELLDHEVSILTKLKGIHGVPRIVHVESPYVVMKPVAVNIDAKKRDSWYLKGEHIRSLVAIVRQAHARGVVHRDLRLRNLMFVTTQQPATCTLHVVDWGCAMYMYEPNPSLLTQNGHGTLSTASPAILQALIEGRPPEPNFR